MRSNSLIQPTGFSWSASRIWLFEQCQKCFYLKYILKTPEIDKDPFVFAYGTAVHETIESISLWDEVTCFDIEYFQWDEKRHESYKEHINKYKSGFVKEDEVLISEIEFIRQDPKQKYPYYWFLDWLVFSSSILEDIKKVWIPKAVEINEDWSLTRHCILHIDWKEIVNKYISPNWYFGISKVKKLQEMKTQAAKWSVNAIKTNNQFTLYHKLKDVFFGKDVLMQLINFYRDPKPDIQKERISKTELDYQKFDDKVIKITESMEANNYNPISTCSYFSGYKDICPFITL